MLTAFADYGPTSKCSDIAAGDPYRVPGNTCIANNGSTMTFDASGNAVMPETPWYLRWYTIAGGIVLAGLGVMAVAKKRR